MTKFFVLAALFLSCLTGVEAHVDCVDSNAIWREAYTGNVSLVHKMTILRAYENIDDVALNQFIMAYAYYRLGEIQSAEKIVEGLDRYLGQYFEL